MAVLPTHGHIRGYSTEDNCLCVSGTKLTEIARDVSVSPVYIYDSRLITQRIVELRELLPRTLKLHYAIKANPMPEVVKHVASLVDGLDVASAGELNVALDTNIAIDEISFAGPGKSDAELRLAVQAGIVINVESPNELQRVDRIAAECDAEAKVAVRVNPDFELKSSGMKMSGGPKPFGIDAETVVQVLDEGLTQRLDLQGFHIFTGSQNLQAASICEAHTKSFNLALALCRESNLRPRFINIGGGLGIPYFPHDMPLDLDPIACNLEHLVRDAHEQLGDVDLVLELGRYLVGEAGIYVAEIVDKKVSRGETFLITNGGLHHHLAASGNFGQVIRKNYPIVIGTNVHSDDCIRADIVGPLCTPLDILGSKTEVPRDTGVGDLVVVFQSGAYGLSASPTRFLSHPPPKEILV